MMPQFFPLQAGRFSIPAPLIYVVVPIHTLGLPVFCALRILSMGGVIGWAFLRALLFRFLAVGFEQVSKALRLLVLFTWGRHLDFRLLVNICVSTVQGQNCQSLTGDGASI